MNNLFYFQWNTSSVCTVDWAEFLLTLLFECGFSGHGIQNFPVYD